MRQNAKKTTIAQIGLGKWGINLLRNFNALPECRLKYGCDLNSDQLRKFSRDYPDVNFTSSYEDVLQDKDVEAVVVATPAPAHYDVALKCLKNGKHVFVEKPITLAVEKAEELVRLAKEVNKKLMVGHLLLYHPAIAKLAELIKNGELGEIYYIYTQRLNLGRIRNTENVVWSLAPHDISIILHLMSQFPQSVSALGASFVQEGIEDVAFLNIRFAGRGIGHIHVSWLDPTKTRRTIVVGSKKMAIFDEVSNRDTLILIDKGVDRNPDFKTFQEFLKLRFGEENGIKIS
ncbi:MAG: Gfo/Idh/MocA family oxidoreductase, partial [Candidatus Margulisiibacteriota bacterium]